MSDQNANSVIEQAQLLIKQGKADDAVRLLNEVCKPSNQDPLQWYTLGVARAESGDISAASLAFEQALKCSPSNLMVLTSLGRIQSRLQKYQQACNYLTQALAINPSHKPATLLLIKAYIAMHDTQQAEIICKSAHKKEPDDLEILLQLALICKSQNKFDEAILHLDKALSMKPNAVQLLVNKGLVLQSMGKVVEAIDIFQHVTQQSPATAELWYIQGMALLSNSDITQAIVCLKQAFELDPTNVMSGKQLAQALRHVGQTADSEVICKKILNVDPTDATALFFQNAFSKQKNNEPLGRIPADVSRQVYKGKNIGVNFDNSLKFSLDYKAPDVLNTAVRDSIDFNISTKIDILELGCGSGLCGSRFIDIANSLIGTDISPDMLEAAKDKHSYTELYEADLIDALDRYQASMDLIIAMDVLCFFGDLTDVFKRCNNALKEKGVFGFSVVKPKTDAVWELQVQGHFVHSLEHLQKIGEKTGFKKIFSEELALRREQAEDQLGYVCLYQKVSTNV